MNEVVSVISTVGFPIFACCGLAWFCKYLIDNITKTINENTKMIQKLITKLGEEDDSRTD